MKNRLSSNALILVTMAILVAGCQKEKLDYPELVDGATFNQFIPASTTSVVFEYNNSHKGTCILSTPRSSVRIYGHLDGTVWHVTTKASTIYANPCCDKMFYGCSKLTSIQFGSGFNTSNVVTMSNAVDSVIYSTAPDGQPYKWYNKYMLFGMFAGCSSLTSLDLSSFNTSQVTDMRGLFDGCKNLTSLNISSFNTSNVKYMDAMFRGCSSLTSLDLSNFNTSNVVSMSYRVKVFYNSGSWGQLPGSGSNWDGGMFMNCNSLTSLDLSNFNTSNVTCMCKLFCNCTHLTFLDLSNFDMTLTNGFSQKQDMCSGLSTSSGICTIVCPESVQNSLLEYYNGNYFMTDIPMDEVTFTWVRP